MPTGLIAVDVERFRAAVARRLGLHFEDARLGLLAEILERRAESAGARPDTYLDRLETARDSRAEVAALARELTVTETYFFRNIEQFQALDEIALPDRIRDRGAARALDVLSAACASGEEAYSLAAVLRQRLPESAGWEITIRGVDVNAAMIDKARRAQYAAWSLRETPADLHRRWFRARGRDFVLDDGLRDMVRFEERNLVEDDPAFWRPDSFDIVFCRNVLMYFTPEAARAAVARVSRSLRPGGFLFLGHAENLRGLSQDFHLRHTHGTFYYQRRSGDGQALSTEAPAVPPFAAVPGVAVVDALSPAGTGGEWAEAIDRAAQRIQTLTVPRAAASLHPLPPRWDLAMATDLLRKESFAEALATLRALPPESARDPDVLLLHAVLVVQGGDLPEAERLCAALLALDDLNAGAHYLLAICREGLGDRQGALQHHQAAVYLDPGFAMPRLRLGLLARRDGEREQARKELGQAFVLLQREDASRVLLFGGGFSRDFLVSLCRAELLACGGAP